LDRERPLKSLGKLLALYTRAAEAARNAQAVWEEAGLMVEAEQRTRVAAAVAAQIPAALAVPAS
jgi:hypothetical protein